MPTIIVLLSSCLLLAGVASWPVGQPPIRGDFAQEVLPLLKSRCFECHDAQKQKAGLRLDVRSKAMAGGESGKPGIVPGQPDKSELLRRIKSDDDNEVMPPKKPRLTADEIKLLEQWVADGAKWPDSLANEAKPASSHWAYQQPKKAALPAVMEKRWPRNPIDHFILARLEKEQLAHSPEADKITLLRRLHLDLIGLPPTLAEVDAYVNDKSDTAYEKAVERLLASPHYGERWGRHWLDAARYADSDGYEKDKSRAMHFYRDWVVNALNRDLPYDQFLREQLAGDLMPKASQDQIVATGFLRNSMLNEEGGVDPEQFRMDAMFDRMDAIGKSMLGITIQCAQCHTHKFDPITHEEYYRLFAFLNNDHEAQRVVYTPMELQKINELTQQMRMIEERLKQQQPHWQAELDQWEAAVKQAAVPWTTLDKLENAGDNGQRYIAQSDGSVLCQGYAPTKFETHLRGPVPGVSTIKAFRLEMLNDPNLPCNGPGRSFMGTFALSEFKVYVTKDKKRQSVKFTKAYADYGNPVRDLEANFDDQTKKKRVTGPIEYAIDVKNDTAWGIDQGPGRRNQSRIAIFVPDKPVELKEGDTLEVYLTQQHGGWNSDDHMNNNLGRFRLSATATDGAEKFIIPPHIQNILQTKADERRPVQQAQLFSFWRGQSSSKPFIQATAEIEVLWQQWPAGSTSLTMQAREMPRETRLLKRGDFLKPDRAVQPGVPAVLNQLGEKAEPSRLQFAQWLTDRQAPTTARVIVNRVWQTYFGTGFVSSAEDLGVQCEQPSHPELLDWLAVEFMDKGWSLKQLHRLIVTSATYRQSSKVEEMKRAKDPYNRLLARAPRLRVEGEIVRDIALHVSGLLNPQVGGPSIFSPAPAFLFQPPASYGPFTWNEATGPDRYRRAFYTFRRRSTPYPMLTNFDAPNGDAACVKRARSNTPLQALTTLNEVVFLEAARAFGQRMWREGGTDDVSRLRYGFRLCTSRLPSETELAMLTKLLVKQRARFADGYTVPAEVLFGKTEMPSDMPKDITPTQWASYTLVARVLLNLDETVTRE
jgi:hypothetical protein